eukprot:jgi/Bigna1/67138/fgenesh1_pg.3_\
MFNRAGAGLPPHSQKKLPRIKSQMPPKSASSYQPRIRASRPKESMEGLEDEMLSVRRRSATEENAHRACKEIMQREENGERRGLVPAFRRIRIISKTPTPVRRRSLTTNAQRMASPSPGYMASTSSSQIRSRKMRTGRSVGRQVPVKVSQPQNGGLWESKLLSSETSYNSRKQGAALNSSLGRSDRFSRPKPERSPPPKAKGILSAVHRWATRKYSNSKKSSYSSRTADKIEVSEPITTSQSEINFRREDPDQSSANPEMKRLSPTLLSSFSPRSADSYRRASPTPSSRRRSSLIQTGTLRRSSRDSSSSAVSQSSMNLNNSRERNGESDMRHFDLQIFDSERFLEPETYNENCGVLSSAVWEWTKRHAAIGSKVADLYAVSVARDTIKKRIGVVAKTLALKLQSDGLVRGCVRWLCNFVGGNTTFRMPDPRTYDHKDILKRADKFLEKGVANSYEFAVMLTAMLQEVNIPSLIVYGYGRHQKNIPQSNDSRPEINHCWNIVRMPSDGSWRFVDVSMCSGSWQEDTIMIFNDAYLFTHPQQFVWQHMPIKALGPPELVMELKDMEKLQMLLPHVDKKTFWEYPVVSTEFIKGQLFFNPSQFRKLVKQEKMKLEYLIACNYPTEIDAKLVARVGGTNYSGCVTVSKSLAVLEKTESGEAMSWLKAVFPYEGEYDLAVYSRRVAASTYKFARLFTIRIEAETGVFEKHMDHNLCLGFVKEQKSLEEKVRGIIRNTLIAEPSGCFHFSRSPFVINIYTPPEVTRVAYVSNVFWSFLKERSSKEFAAAKKRFTCKVLIDRSGTFATHFEIGGRFIRALEFTGLRRRKERLEVKALKSSEAAGQTFLFDIQDPEKKKKMHKAITKRNGDLDMDQYGRCITAELQIRRITKESFNVTFDLRSRKEWNIQGACFEGWHVKSTPLPSHCVEVESLRRVKTEASSNQTYWRVKFKLPEIEGKRYSMQVE